MADFVVLDIGRSPKAPIILGRPFLHTVKVQSMSQPPRCVSISMAKSGGSSLALHTYEITHLKPIGPNLMTSIPLRVKTKFYQEPIIKGWQDVSWPVKKGDPGHPIILVSIGPNTQEAVYDLGAAVNIIPMSVYDNVL